MGKVEEDQNDRNSSRRNIPKHQTGSWFLFFQSVLPVHRIVRTNHTMLDKSLLVNLVNVLVRMLTSLIV